MVDSNSENSSLALTALPRGVPSSDETNYQDRELRQLVKTVDAECDANPSDSAFVDDLDYVKARWPNASLETLRAVLALLR